MISYAQNREDVLLNRVLGGSTGFYVDVGASHPTFDSVTRWFYEQGWRGINIEPLPGMYQKLAKRRPRDINLNIGVSNTAGSLLFHEVAESKDAQGDVGGRSTFDPAIAEQHRRAGRLVTDFVVPVRTLSEVLAEHEVGDISFLKIDVEGHERQVIEGLDLRRYRPRVILLEATRPMATIASHGEWEPLLLAAGYLYATFDGLNRYYVRQEDHDLLERLEAPATVLDDFVPYDIAVRDAKYCD